MPTGVTPPHQKNLSTKHALNPLPPALATVYTTQRVNVWGSELNLMHPVEARVSQQMLSHTTFPWHKEAFVELLAEKSMNGAFHAKQRPVNQSSQTVWLPTVEAAGYVKAGGLAEVPVGLARSLMEASDSAATPYLVAPLYVGTQRLGKQRVQLFLDDPNNEAQTRQLHVDVVDSDFRPVKQQAFELQEVFRFTLPVADLERLPDSDEVSLILNQTEHPYRHMAIVVYQTNLDGIAMLLIHHEAEAGTRSFFDISTNKPLKSVNPYVGSRFAEIRRFTFFSRVLNALQWALVDAHLEARLLNQPAPLLIPPEAVLLNDWQVGAVAALTRYTALYQAEDRYVQCLQGIASKLSAQEQALVHQHYVQWGQFFARTQQHHVLLHNVAYQGEHPNHRLGDHQKTEYLYNLLFDHYAARVMKHAHSLNHSSLPNTLMKNIAIENRFNLLRMAVGAADKLVAVSPNYATELSKHDSLGGLLRPLLSWRANKGTLLGITNGYNKSELLPTQAWLQTQVPEALSRSLAGIDSLWKAVQTYSTPQGKVADARLPLLSNRALVFGSGLQPALAQAIEVRRHNRAIWRSWMANLPEVLKESILLKDITDVGAIDADAPIFYTVGRLVDQKGFDQFALAAERLLQKLHEENARRWLNHQPLLPIPGFVIQGSGDEACRRPWVDLKQTLARQRRTRLARAIVLIDTPDATFKNAAMLGCDFFVVASKFEPCGLVQMEALACGTPVVATAVGGLNDTISHGNTGYLTHDDIWFNTHLPQDVSHNAMLLAEQLWQAYWGFVDQPTVYEAMQIEALSQNFSWSLGPMSAYQALLSLQR
jgi:glycogen synthase